MSNQQMRGKRVMCGREDRDLRGAGAGEGSQPLHCEVCLSEGSSHVRTWCACWGTESLSSAHRGQGRAGLQFVGIVPTMEQMRGLRVVH